jgi:serine/threonine protein kinase
MDDDSIESLIARSSLGSAGAVALRRRAPKALIQRLLEKADRQEVGREILLNDGHRPMQSGPTGYHRRRFNEQPSGEFPMALYPGQFTIRSVRPLGAGGLGTVDEVEVVATNQSHALGTRLARKRLGPNWANDAGAQARFEREIEILGTMRHAHVVSLEGVSLPGGERWYVMPLYPRSLRAALQEGHFLANATDAARFIARIADALSYAHSLNFIHRDLKPENILLNDANEPVVADWGLGQFVHLHSKVLDLTRGGPMGTGYYCSLEQWTTGRCEVSGDVYSLGVIFAELVAKRALPIQPMGSGIRQDLVSGLDATSRALNAIVRKMTMLMPSARHQSMSEVAKELRAAVRERIASHARW